MGYLNKHYGDVYMYLIVAPRFNSEYFQFTISKINLSNENFNKKLNKCTHRVDDSGTV